MRPYVRHRRAVWVAACAALAQLWLGTLHASIDASIYCGDGNPGRSAALLQQLPPELRLPIDRLDSPASTACEFCALACAAIVPISAATAELARLRFVAPDFAPTPAAPPAGRPDLPPVRGPPATR